MSFDFLAPHYDWLEAVTAGQRLQRARTAWLDALQNRRRVLSAGEGHGRFAAACAARFPHKDLTCIEASAGMLAHARQRIGDPSRLIHWECTDVFDWRPTGSFDAVVTCFFLDCFPPMELAAVIAKLAACAAPEAVWLVADFAVPERGPARWRAQAVHRLMYAFFRAFTALPARRLTPPDELLRTHGFRLVGRREFDWGLLRADLWQRGA